eukprot:GHVS01065204.1.p2 GENE.GHVS01065204.1~~GHVS01065204.1.p2  ORF type:complete len:121 (+),score=21.65 GHVS01065204.1:739-1101(+)
MRVSRRLPEVLPGCVKHNVLECVNNTEWCFLQHAVVYLNNTQWCLLQHAVVFVYNKQCCLFTATCGVYFRQRCLFLNKHWCSFSVYNTYWRLFSTRLLGGVAAVGRRLANLAAEAPSLVG